jgi:hypothetical protein
MKNSIRPNEWTQMSGTYWMCFRYDVFFEYGDWYASFYVGRPYSREFRTAEAAMRYCDSLDREI